MELLEYLKERKAIETLQSPRGIGYLTKSKRAERDAKIARKPFVEAEIRRLENSIRREGMYIDINVVDLTSLKLSLTLYRAKADVNARIQRYI